MVSVQNVKLKPQYFAPLVFVLLYKKCNISSQIPVLARREIFSKFSCATFTVHCYYVETTTRCIYTAWLVCMHMLCVLIGALVIDSSLLCLSTLLVV